MQRVIPRLNPIPTVTLYVNHRKRKRQWKTTATKITATCKMYRKCFRECVTRNAHYCMSHAWRKLALPRAPRKNCTMSLFGLQKNGLLSPVEVLVGPYVIFASETGPLHLMHLLLLRVPAQRITVRNWTIARQMLKATKDAFGKQVRMFERARLSFRGWMD